MKRSSFLHFEYEKNAIGSLSDNFIQMFTEQQFVRNGYLYTEWCLCISFSVLNILPLHFKNLTCRLYLGQGLTKNDMLLQNYFV